MHARSEEKTPDDKQKEDARTRAKGGEQEDFNAVKGGKKGKSKGYGACWHCGEWGHPRRGCPQLRGAQKGTVNAVKGKRKGFKGKGKGFKGGKGKGYKGGYRSPGTVVGKGLNYYCGDEYSEAWGDEHYKYNHDYSEGDCGYETYNGGYVGNLTMMLERGNGVTERDAGRRNQIKVEKLGACEALTGRVVAKLVKLQNGFDALCSDENDL